MSPDTAAVTTTIKSETVDHVDDQYTKFSGYWSKCRDVIEGEDTVKNAGKTYLPKPTGMDPKSYEAYKMRPDFFNASKRASKGYSGFIFRKNPKYTVPAGIESFTEDITMTGTSLRGFAQKCVQEVVDVGRVGVWVDYPDRPDTDRPLTQQEAEQLNLRPYLQFYLAENILGWDTRRVGGATVLSQVRLKEFVPADSDDEFEQIDIPQIRVLDLDENGYYRQRTYQQNADDTAWILQEVYYPTMNSSRMTRIPFIFVSPEDTEPDYKEPPLLDLVNINLAHYRQNTTLFHALHFGIPTLLFTGYNPDVDGDEIYIGGDTAVTLQNPDADGKFVEYTGKGAEPLSENIDKLEKRMALLSLRMLAHEKKAAEAAETEAIRQAGEHSILANIANNMGKALTQAMEFVREWGGAEGEVEVELNTDFVPGAIDPQLLKTLIMGVQSGEIPPEDLFNAMQNGELIDPELDYDTWAAKKETNATIGM